MGRGEVFRSLLCFRVRRDGVIIVGVEEIRVLYYNIMWIFR